MKKTEVSFSHDKLIINGIRYQMIFPIEEAFLSSGTVVVLLDDEATFDPVTKRPLLLKFHNLLGFDEDGRNIWEAELPSPSDRPDHYWGIVSREPLIANTFSSFECRIDPKTGRIIKKIFFK